MSHNICRSMIFRNDAFWPSWHRCWSMSSESLFKFRTLLDADCRSKITMLILCVKESNLWLCLLLTREALSPASLGNISRNLMWFHHACEERHLLQAQSPDRPTRVARAGGEAGSSSFRARLSALEALGQQPNPSTPSVRKTPSRLSSLPSSSHQERVSFWIVPERRGGGGQHASGGCGSESQ